MPDNQYCYPGSNVNATESITIKGVKAQGTQDGWAGNINKDLPFTLETGTENMEKTPGTYDVTFTWDSNNNCKATAVASANGTESN